LGARAVVHKSSTTGIESALLDKPVFSYRPIKDKKFDSELPILVSTEKDDYQSLRHSLCKDFSNYSTSFSPEVEGRLKRYVHNLEGPSAGPTIAETIDSLDVTNNISIQDIQPSLETKLKRSGIRLFGSNLVETVGEVVFGTDRTVRNKFPGLTSEELESEIRIITRASDNDFPPVNIDEVSCLANTFTLTEQK
jgi:hypothetical protein